MLNVLQTGEIKAKQANKLDVGKVNLCIVIITLFQEDNIFGVYASLTCTPFFPPYFLTSVCLF